MAGYSNPPGALINEIRNLLSNRYKEGFPILKEIIQNANDGGATRLDFGVISSLNLSVNHPLLAYPALFFINNGGFTRDDQRAITCFGIDANARDNSKIGKFGLGQKSIFHLCEAFFFIARSSDIPDGCGEFINPWADSQGYDPKHETWDELKKSDRESIINYFKKSNLIKEENYFILWLPLRSSNQAENYIFKNFYDELARINNEFSNQLDIQLGQILPMLRSVQNIHYWISNSKGNIEENFVINCERLNQKLARSIYPKRQEQDNYNPIIRPLQGTVLSNNQEIFQFAGTEKILSYQLFQTLLNSEVKFDTSNFWQELQQSQWWTKRQALNEKYEPYDEPDKAIPHCLVLFNQQQSQTNSKSKLKIQWSVFLPLADSVDTNDEGDRKAGFEEIPCDGDKNYTIIIHGYFFLDSARRHIKFLADIRDGKLSAKIPNSQEEMEQQWNYLLATQGSLRQILPVFKSFVEEAVLSESEINSICKALKLSTLFSQNYAYKNSIVTEYQWVFRTNPLINQWQLIGADATVRSLPSIPSKSIWDTFPQLEKLAEQYCLTVEGKPNLLAGKNTPTWKSEEICDIINSLEPSKIFSNIDNLSFLQAFLSQPETKVINDEKVQVSLRELLHKAFAELGIAELQKDKIIPFVKKLVELLLPKNRYAIAKFAADEQSVHSILNKLYALNLDLLIVYATFEHNPLLFSQAKLNPQQGVKILTCLSNIFKEEPLTRKVSQELILRVLNNFDKPETVLNDLPNTPLLLGYNSRDEKQYIYTYSQLQAQAKNNFFNGSITTPIAMALREALPDCDLIFIDDRLTNILKKIPFFINIPKCDRNSCLELLAKKPKLADSDKRINLLKELIRHV